MSFPSAPACWGAEIKNSTSSLVTHQLWFCFSLGAAGYFGAWERVAGEAATIGSQITNGARTALAASPKLFAIIRWLVKSHGALSNPHFLLFEEENEEELFVIVHQELTRPRWFHTVCSFSQPLFKLRGHIPVLQRKEWKTLICIVELTARGCGGL